MSDVLEIPVVDAESKPAEKLPPSAVFRDLALAEELQLAIQKAGYITPTQVQEQIIPLMLEGKDVLAQSQTGTGKTAAFALPILSNLDPQATKPQVLVLAPTRELATQVAKSFESYGNFMHKLKVAAIYGGADYEPQLRLLKRGAQVVVGTPGRVLDHIRRGTLKLDGIRCLVLDEADEMLNMGFLEDVEFVLKATPEEKQIALFSATLPGPIRKIADQHLKDPAVVTIRKKTLTADSIEQRCVFVEERDKPELLARLLEIEETDGVIVFTKTKDSTITVAERLTDLGLRAAALNGDLPQARRQRTVDQLKSGKLDILVATDVAARGLDVQRISHVFNYDLPHDSESYVHRIGRTGRAGRTGVAIIFLTFRQRGKLRLIENVTKKAIQVIEQPTANEINAARIRRFKDQITIAAQHDDLALYRKVVSDHVIESGESIETVAAALAHMAHGGRSLLVKDIPKSKRSPHDNDFSRGPGGKGGRRERAGGEKSFDRGRPVRTPEAGMQRYWIGVGHSDGVRPNNIVGAVANESGISGKQIGPIKILDEYSTIDLPTGLSSETLSTLEKTWVSGKQLRIRVWSPGRGKTSGSEHGGSSASPRTEFKPKKKHFGGKAKKPFKAKAAFGGEDSFQKKHKKKRDKAAGKPGAKKTKSK